MSASVFREQLCMNKSHLSAPDDTCSLCVKRCLKSPMLLQIYTGYYLYVEWGVHCVERGVHCVERGVHSVEWGVHCVEWGVHCVEWGVHCVEWGVHCVEWGVHCVEWGVHCVEWGVHCVEWGVHFGVHVLCHLFRTSYH